MAKYSLLTFVLFLPNISFSQAPEIEWQNTIGGTLTDNLQAIQQTIDNGYILGGYSNSTNTGDKNEVGNGGDDYWVIKLDSLGNIEWQNTIGGNFLDRLLSIQQTEDGGYIAGGYSSSPLSGDKTEDAFGNNDYWIIKLDSVGIIQWQNNIGGSLDDLLYIVQTRSGEYILGGSSSSNISFDKTSENYGGYDYWVVKLNETGDVIWDKSFGGSADDKLTSINNSVNDKILIGGYSNSNISGNKTENSKGGYDYWILELDSTGSLIWQKTIGGNSDDILSSINQTQDLGAILGGSSNSNISGDKSEPTIGVLGRNDYWIIKLDSVRNIEWQNTVGGDSYDDLTSIITTFDDKYIIAGTSLSDLSGDKTEFNYGLDDYWILKLDNDGSILWQKVFGGSSVDFLHKVIQTNEGGYFIGGYSNSGISGNKNELNIGSSDYWVIKLNAEECVSPSTYYVDNDGDGFGWMIDSILSCLPVSGYVSNFTDCNDLIDEINPDASELCNDIDDDCNFIIDDGLDYNTYYQDDDNDGYGNILSNILSCNIIIPIGYTVDSTDCDDTNNMVHPGQPEICNTTDENCNNLIDEGLTENRFFIDQDDDGYGYSSLDTITCFSEVFGYVNDSTDCNDLNPNINPGAIELPNEFDDNCNDTIDEGYTMIYNHEALNFQIYPNPNNGQFEISHQNVDFGIIEVVVYNLIGEAIYSNKFHKDEQMLICLPNLYAGPATVKILFPNFYLGYVIYVN